MGAQVLVALVQMTLMLQVAVEVLLQLEQMRQSMAQVIAKNLNAIQIRSDAVRKHLAAIDLNQTGSLDIYSLEMSQKTFARLAELAEILIALGYPVILDARYDKYAWREPLLYVDSVPLAANPRFPPEVMPTSVPDEPNTAPPSELKVIAPTT